MFPTCCLNNGLGNELEVMFGAKMKLYAITHLEKQKQHDNDSFLTVGVRCTHNIQQEQQNKKPTSCDDMHSVDQ